MKKVFITGITGTVAPYVKEELLKGGYDVYNRHFHINTDTDIDNLHLYLLEVKPDIIIHLALGPVRYVEKLAKYCKNNHKVFVYISTVSVFEDNRGGPYYVDSEVHVKNEYGAYKYNCENVVKQIKEDSYIIRIGWQISETGNASSNNMFQFIKNNTNENNEIIVSDRFYPSTSFLDQTAKSIVSIIENKQPDLYFVNSNLDKSLFDIVQLLNNRYQLGLTVLKDSSFSRNDIMIDKRVVIEKL